MNKNGIRSVAYVIADCRTSPYGWYITASRNSSTSLASAKKFKTMKSAQKFAETVKGLGSKKCIDKISL